MPLDTDEEDTEHPFPHKGPGAELSNLIPDLSLLTQGEIRH